MFPFGVQFRFAAIPIGECGRLLGTERQLPRFEFAAQIPHVQRPFAAGLLDRHKLAFFFFNRHFALVEISGECFDLVDCLAFRGLPHSPRHFDGRDLLGDHTALIVQIHCTPLQFRTGVLQTHAFTVQLPIA